MRLPVGKVPMETLEELILSSIKKGKNIEVGPSLGVDFAAINLDGQYLIISSDPVTGVQSNIGWYAVHVCCNDVATSGVKPSYLEVVILLPNDSDTTLVKKISDDILSAASELDVSIIGGHTELTRGIDKPIIITTAMGLAKTFVTSRDVRPNDILIMSKYAAIEGTMILLDKFREKLFTMDSNSKKRLVDVRMDISIIDDAVTAFKTGYVHAMHDPTEGGVLGGVYEMSIASNTGFELMEEKIPLLTQTKSMCDVLKVDPLKLISSGALLMAVDPDGVDEVILSLKNKGIPAKVVGIFRPGDRTLIKKTGEIEVIRSSPVDELWRLISK